MCWSFVRSFVRSFVPHHPCVPPAKSRFHKVFFFLFTPHTYNCRTLQYITVISTIAPPFAYMQSLHYHLQTLTLTFYTYMHFRVSLDLVNTITIRPSIHFIHSSSASSSSIALSHALCIIASVDNGSSHQVIVIRSSGQGCSVIQGTTRVSIYIYIYKYINKTKNCERRTARFVIIDTQALQPYFAFCLLLSSSHVFTRTGRGELVL